MQALLFLAKVPGEGHDCFAFRLPARGGISAGRDPCTVFISSKEHRMGKSQHSTASSDRVWMSPGGLGRSQGIPACLGRE